MATAKDIQKLQERVWNGSLPLEIRLAPGDCRIYDRADPYLVSNSIVDVLYVALLMFIQDPCAAAVIHSFSAYTPAQLLPALLDRQDCPTICSLVLI